MTSVPEKSDKEFMLTLLLCFFLGGLGAHRFYVGKKGTAIAMILTLGGGIIIWPIIDLVLITTGQFKDSEGRVVKQ